MSTISTHVLDTARGRPAAGLPVRLEFKDEDGAWRELASGLTDAGGRIGALLPPARPLQPGLYRLVFDTAAYFAATETEGFYPYVHVVFEVRAAGEHHHVPLLLSPYGYTTYRGS
ncbi:MAG: 5-hydroxyisourate hydrolase [Planctomycetota bacterium]|nr:MAG: 5-hydroxyisourate hydrolase [Planctomycetota bacterium]